MNVTKIVKMKLLKNFAWRNSSIKEIDGQFGAAQLFYVLYYKLYKKA